MNGIVRKIEGKKLRTSDGREFEKVEFTIDVIANDKGDVRTLKASMSKDYCKKYFGGLNIKSSDLIGQTVGVVTAKRAYEKDGEQKTCQYIKYINILDENGKPVFVKEKETSEVF